MYTQVDENDHGQSIRDRLTVIKTYIENELMTKQIMLGNMERKVSELETQLQECRIAHEGTKQLVNKLLNDIDGYRRDISWYKKTYQSGGVLGFFKQKFFRRSNTGNKDR